MVVIYHYSFRYGQLYGYNVLPIISFPYGKYGVQLFFMVSGFVIFMTLEKSTRLSDFIVSRLSRLYPAYWVAVILTFLAVRIFTLPGREIRAKYAAMNLTMIHPWFGVPYVDGVYWTLVVELSFYALMCILFIAKLLPKIELVSWIWLSIMAVSTYLSVNQIIEIPWRIHITHLLDYGNLFIAGIMFYKLMHQPQRSQYYILFSALFIEYFIYRHLFILVAIFFAVFWAFTKGYLSVLATRPLIFLGSISYSLYLIHQNIGYIVIQNLEKYHWANPISIIIVPFTVSVITASLMFNYIEKPGMKFIREKWRTIRAEKNPVVPVQIQSDQT